MGSGTTGAVAQKMGRKYIGMEMGGYFEDVTIKRQKYVINGEQGGISKSVKWQGGGMFKYYELEQYEDVLSKVAEEGTIEGNNREGIYIFDRNYTDTIKIDEEGKVLDFVYKNLYGKDKKIDLIETISNATGEKIMSINEDEFVLEKSGVYKLNPLAEEEIHKIIKAIKKLIYWK